MGYVGDCCDFIILLEELVWEAWLCNMDMVLGCLMWIVRKEWNGHLFEDNVISLDQLKSVFQHTLWAWCWDFSDCSSVFEFLASLRPAL